MPWKLDGQSDDNNLIARDYQIGSLQNVHYIEGGNRDGLPVVFLHTNMASSRWWEAAQEQLPYRYRSFALDMRGFGGTEYKPVASISDFANDLHDFVTALDLPKFALVGWGLGGGVAMQYALAHETKLAGLILVNSISPKGHRPPERAEQLDELSRSLRSNNIYEISTYLRRNYFYGGNFPVGDMGADDLKGTGANANDAAFEYIMQGSMQARTYTFAEQEGIFYIMRKFNIAADVAKLTVPTYQISSADDRIVRPDEQREIRDLFTVRQHPFDSVTITRCGHSPMVERSDVFMQALNGFLGRFGRDV
jgi:pimeloyl-ACP methyl ester carboxylesterase